MKKCLWDAIGIPIGRAHYNPILDTIVYEVEYLDGNKASLSANTIAANIFSQVDEEGDIFVMFDEIVHHRVVGKETMHQYAFVFSKN